MFLNLMGASTAVKTRKRTQKNAPLRLAKRRVFMGGVLVV